MAPSATLRPLAERPSFVKSVQACSLTLGATTMELKHHWAEKLHAMVAMFSKGLLMQRAHRSRTRFVLALWVVLRYKGGHEDAAFSLSCRGGAALAQLLR